MCPRTSMTHVMCHTRQDLRVATYYLSYVTAIEGGVLPPSPIDYEEAHVCANNLCVRTCASCVILVRGHGVCAHDSCAYSLHPTPTAYSLQPTAHSLQPTACVCAHDACLHLRKSDSYIRTWQGAEVVGAEAGARASHHRSIPSQMHDYRYHRRQSHEGQGAEVIGAHVCLFVVNGRRRQHAPLDSRDIREIVCGHTSPLRLVPQLIQEHHISTGASHAWPLTGTRRC